MKIGIIGPCEDEINPFIISMHGVQIEKHAMLNFYVGKYADIDIVALFCGVCKVNAAIAAQILIDKYEVSQIIVTGVAGAIDKRLKVLDTVISSEVAYHDVANEILTNYHPWMESIYFKADKEMLEGLNISIEDPSVYIGRIVTGEAFITDDGRQQIIERFNPLCVDMETASIAHVCYVNSIPFIAIRTMSDSAKESGNDAFERYVAVASKKSIDILKRFLNSTY